MHQQQEQEQEQEQGQDPLFVTIDVPKLNLQTMCKHPSCFIIGGTDEQRMTLIRNLLYSTRDIPCGILVDTSSRSSRKDGIFPNELIYDDIGCLNDAFKRQRKMCKRKQSDDDRMHVVILNDDPYADVDYRKTPEIIKLLMNGQCYKMFAIIAFKYPVSISPSLYANVDYKFVFNEPNPIFREQIWKNYFPKVPTYDAFSTLMDGISNDGSCMVSSFSFDTTKSFGIQHYNPFSDPSKDTPTPFQLYDNDEV